MISRGVTYQDLEIQITELAQRRKTLEQKLEEKLKLFKDFQHSQKESQKRLIKQYQEQNEQAKIRNASFLQELSILTAGTQLQRDLTKIKHSSNSSHPSLSNSDNYLLKAKKTYEQQFENHLPLYYRENTYHMEEKVKKIQILKLQSKHRSTLLKQELLKEQQMKNHLYQQKQELMNILTIEQKDLMANKVNALLLKEENHLIEQELKSYLKNEGYRMESMIKDELDHFNPSSQLSLPVTSQATFSSIPPVSSSILHHTANLPIPSSQQHHRYPLSSSSTALYQQETFDNSAAAKLSSFKDNSTDDLTGTTAQSSVAEKPSVSFPQQQQQQFTKPTVSSLASKSRSEHQLNQPSSNLLHDNMKSLSSSEMIMKEHNQPKVITQPLNDDLSSYKPSLTISQDNLFYTISNSNQPSPVHGHQENQLRALINRSESEFQFNLVDENNISKSKILSDKPVLSSFSNDQNHLQGKPEKSDVVSFDNDNEFDVIEEAKEEKTESPKSTHRPLPSVPVAPAPAPTRSASPPTISLQQQPISTSTSLTAPAANPVVMEKVDVKNVSMDTLNKILNKCYHFIESFLTSINIVSSIYDISYIQKVNSLILKELLASVDQVNNDFWENHSINKDNLYVVGGIVLYLLSERGFQLLPRFVIAFFSVCFLFRLLSFLAFLVSSFALC
jgi:hypothetical protein